MSTRPAVIAHRGACGYRPEHSLSSYLLAIEQGADAAEPDLVATRDGVLVIRHENEISGTTDVADHPEFADRRTTRVIDGEEHHGWFTEDFDWAELATLRVRERVPELRPESAAFDGREGILRLDDLVALLKRAPRPVRLVAEIKHASYFASIGLPLDELFADGIRGWATDGNLVVESFEQSVLGAVRARGVPGRLVMLVDTAGRPADQPARGGRDFASYLTAEGLAALAREVDGVSVDAALLLAERGEDEPPGTSDLVERIHAAGLDSYAWTLRPENRFLHPAFRRGDDPAAHGDWMTAFRLIMSTGVDGVFADHPDLALRARAALGVGGRA
ncbi:glycerophosphodiester phosphodiesterase family protein [Galbitalea soli]|uniref:glycerophosphodiester phosphodiesterase n=1 Tax=Galbitalea soli TaxID=1268042 RepID=A0A7C9TS92_9MICO|nr:glycerophosphodiester phosphodiesterase [Galbitalea soli]NYJ31831.1 glycerophosphoryl diester phosphodiesterase [Galbitalea soli]